MKFWHRLQSAAFFQRPSRSHFLNGLVETAAGIAIAVPLLGLLGGIWWGFDLLSHFRVQSIAGLLLASVYALVVRKPRQGWLYFGVAAAFSLTLLPYFLPQPSVNAAGPTIKVISYNVHTGNSHHAEVRDWLLAQNADVVFLMEVNEQWLTDLQLAARYPHAIESPREDNFGLAVYSQHPFASEELLYFTPSQIPSVRFSLLLKGVPLNFFGIHTLPPISADYSQERDDQLVEVARRIAAQPDALHVTMGDLNLTPYSRKFSRFLRESGLVDTARGFGLPLTWMKSKPLIAIPIDHVLISPRLAVRDRQTGPRMGSDHHPLTVILQLP